MGNYACSYNPRHTRDEQLNYLQIAQKLKIGKFTCNNEPNNWDKVDQFLHYPQCWGSYIGKVTSY